MTQTNFNDANNTIMQTTSYSSSCGNVCGRFKQVPSTPYNLTPCVKCQCNNICKPCGFQCNECLQCYT